MKLAIWEIYMGINEMIVKGDGRRLWQVCHNIKRGLIIIFTLGKVIPKKTNYHEFDTLLNEEMK